MSTDTGVLPALDAASIILVGVPTLYALMSGLLLAAVFWNVRRAVDARTDERHKDAEDHWRRAFGLSVLFTVCTIFGSQALMVLLLRLQGFMRYQGIL